MELAGEDNMRHLKPESWQGVALPAIQQAGLPNEVDVIGHFFVSRTVIFPTRASSCLSRSAASLCLAESFSAVTRARK